MADLDRVQAVEGLALVVAALDNVVEQHPGDVAAIERREHERAEVGLQRPQAAEMGAGAGGDDAVVVEEHQIGAEPREGDLEAVRDHHVEAAALAVLLEPVELDRERLRLRPGGRRRRKGKQHPQSKDRQPLLEHLSLPLPAPEHIQKSADWVAIGRRGGTGARPPALNRPAGALSRRCE